MKTVMVSGFFDPMHDVHAAYCQHAMNYGDYLLCIVASDEQVRAKKGKVNIPETVRMNFVDVHLRGMGIAHQVAINYQDKDGSVAEALRFWRPDVFCRGNDKSPETFPEQEKKACEDCGIKVVYAKFTGQRHSSDLI